MKNHLSSLSRALVGRSSSLTLLAAGLSLAGVALAGAALAEGEEEAPAALVIDSSVRQTHHAALALGYRPVAGESLIVSAQRAAKRTDSAEAYAALALAFMQRKRETSDAAHFQRAHDALEAARERNPDAMRVLVASALLAQDEHRFERALAVGRQLVQRRPSDPIGHLVAGDALLELGDYDEALAAYQRAMDLRPDLRSYNRAAHLRWLHGDFEGAREALELALDAGSPRDPEAMAWCYVDLGMIHLERGDSARALAAADRASRLVEGYVPAMALQARGLASAGRKVEAVEVLKRATERRPHVEDLLLLSELQDELDQPERAHRSLEEARALAGGDPRPLAHHLARHDIELDEALRLSELELTGRRNIAALDTYALVLTRRGDLEAAGRLLDEAMALGTERADLHLHRALWHLRRGDGSAAERSLERALAINPQADPRLVAEITEEVK